MSFSLEVTFADGVPAVGKFSGTLPSAGYVIGVSGHSDSSQVNIGARYDAPDGGTLVSTYGTAKAAS